MADKPIDKPDDKSNDIYRGSPKHKAKPLPDSTLVAISELAEQQAKALLEHCESNIDRPGQCLLALILATTYLARDIDMDLHTLLSAIMAAYKDDTKLVITDEDDYPDENEEGERK